MRDVLLDADAFRFLRGLGLLDEVLVALRADRAVVMTEYVARHELSALAGDVARLEAAGQVTVERVLARSAAGRRYREFQRVADKGEAESIAWALERPPRSRPLFISRDAGARRFAAEQRVPHTDVFGVMVEAVLAGRLTRDRAASAVEVWEDKTQQLGRPADYETFDRTFAVRESERARWSDSADGREDESGEQPPDSRELG